MVAFSKLYVEWNSCVLHTVLYTPKCMRGIVLFFQGIFCQNCKHAKRHVENDRIKYYQLF